MYTKVWMENKSGILEKKSSSLVGSPVELPQAACFRYSSVPSLTKGNQPCVEGVVVSLKQHSDRKPLEGYDKDSDEKLNYVIKQND